MREKSAEFAEKGGEIYVPEATGSDSGDAESIEVSPDAMAEAAGD